MTSLQPNPWPGHWYDDAACDRTLSAETIVEATLDEVWEAWTTSEGLATFLTPSCNVELGIGGPFEVYFLRDNPYGSRGSEYCRILSYLPKRMLSFEWNAPPQFEDLRNHRHTWVVLFFEVHDENHVRVELNQYGWGKGKSWNALFDYFSDAWPYVLDNFKKSFTEGPRKWKEE